MLLSVLHRNSHPVDDMCSLGHVRGDDHGLVDAQVREVVTDDGGLPNVFEHRPTPRVPFRIPDRDTASVSRVVTMRPVHRKVELLRPPREDYLLGSLANQRLDNVLWELDVRHLVVHDRTRPLQDGPCVLAVDPYTDGLENL